MPAESEFTVIYDGDALRDGSIDVRDLAPALLGLGDLVAETNREVTGGQVAVALRVRSEFERGSFQVNLEIGQLYERFVQIFLAPTRLLGRRFSRFSEYPECLAYSSWLSERKGANRRLSLKLSRQTKFAFSSKASSPST